MLFFRFAVLIGFLSIAGAAAAPPPYALVQKAVTNTNNFWSVWGSAQARFVSASDLDGGVAQRVVISPKPRQPWDVGASTDITKPVKKGDVLLLMFWARVAQPPSGSNLVMFSGRIYEKSGGSGGGGVSKETTFLVGKSWRRYYVVGRAVKDYPVGTLSAGLIMGVGEMIVDFGPVTVYDFGPDYNVNMLPRN